MPRNSNPDDQRRNVASRERDEDGWFSIGNVNGTSQSCDDDNDYRTSGQYGRPSDDHNSGEGRGWHGDPEGHAAAGHQSHDSCGASRSDGRYEDDVDCSGSNQSSNNRDRDQDGHCAGNSRSSNYVRQDDQYEFDAWHA